MIFISAPYTSEDKSIVEKRVEKVAQYSAKLLVENRPCVSPITLGTTILKYSNLPSDFGFWKKLSLDLIAVCDTVHVLKLEGWDKSVGVANEIEFAIKENKFIQYIEVKTI